MFETRSVLEREAPRKDRDSDGSRGQAHVPGQLEACERSDRTERDPDLQQGDGVLERVMAPDLHRGFFLALARQRRERALFGDLFVDLTAVRPASLRILRSTIGHLVERDRI